MSLSINLIRKNIRATSGLLVSYSPPYSPNALMPDNGLATLAGVLKNAGHQIRILDYCTTDTMRHLIPEAHSKKLAEINQNIQLQITQGAAPLEKDIRELLSVNQQLEEIEKTEVERVSSEILDLVKEKDADWVGFKLWVGPGFKLSVDVSRELKKAFPNLSVFGGGSQVDLFGENIFTANPSFDLLVYGDGEETLLRHVERIGGSGEEIGDINNTIYKAGDQIKRTSMKRVDNLDQIPYPIYDVDIYPAMKKDKILIPVINESQGCDNFCAFCEHAFKSGGQITLKSPQRVADEMENLFSKFGATRFRFGGSSTPGKHLVEISHKIIEKALKVKYACFSRVIDAIVGDYPFLKQAGFFSQFIGIESGDQGILDAMMAKKMDVQLAEEVAKASIAADIYTVLSFIFPAPGETETSAKNTLNYIKKVHPHAVMVTPPMVSPNSAWGKNSGKYGIRVENDFQLTLMQYRLRYLLPPQLREGVPWSIDGKDSKKIMQETAWFIGEVKKMGIPFGISDDMALMADAAGISPDEFVKLSSQYFNCGEVDNVDRLVEKVNHGILTYKG